MKGNNYAARHGTGAFSAPACLSAESEKQQNMKKEKAGRGALAGGCRRFFHPILRGKPDIRLK